MRTLALALLLSPALQETKPAEFYVAPDGKEANAGTKESPWDLATAVSNPKRIPPGSTIWIRGGQYRGKFHIVLAGTEAAPIQIRGVAGERVSILDSGLALMKGSDYLHLRDLEIAGTAPVEKRVTDQTGSWPKEMPGTGGLDVHAGRDCKFINLVIHDNVMGGVGWWTEAPGGEMHGCIIYNNGWKAPDRTHGHCIYTQNKDGIKTISNCILTVPEWGGSYSMHAYGSGKAYVDNFVIEDNIAYERGPFLVGGGRPSNNLTVRRNYLSRVDMMVGYTAKENEDCVVRDNVLSPGRLTIKKFKKVVDEGNVMDKTLNRTVLIPNKYDPNRAHVAVYNAAKAPESKVALNGFLKAGDAFRVMDPKDFFGKPLFEGTCQGDSISIPVSGEFAALVLVRK